MTSCSSDSIDPAALNYCNFYSNLLRWAAVGVLIVALVPPFSLIHPSSPVEVRNKPYTVQTTSRYGRLTPPLLEDQT